MSLLLYGELAPWFHLLTAPAEYGAEAGFYHRVVERAASRPVTEVLELGSGGGNNASHLKAWWRLTLVDVSPAMLELSRRLNPECDHVVGDMRSVRLQRTFDAVFVHDAVDYLTTRDDLRAAMETAFVHLAPGGVALFAPDCTTETFRPDTEHGGHDGEGRALRYLEWSWDPDPADDTYVSEMVYVMRQGEQVRTEHERHELGMFPRRVWLELLADVGFEAGAVPFDPDMDEAGLEVFLGVRT